MVSSELPDSEFFLKTLKRGIDRAAARKIGSTPDLMEITVNSGR